jgi:co-chaperonin GroES (HSP10)
MRKLTLLGNRVLCSPLKHDESSPGGILYAAAYQQEERRYRVLAVGPGVRREDGGYNRIECKPGDVVIVEPFMAHVKVQEPEGEVRVFDSSAIIAVEMSQYENCEQMG